MTQEQIKQMQAELEAARAENARLKAEQAKEASTFKINEKNGSVSCYGLGRFPVTLYYGQWIKLFGKIEALKAFLEDPANTSIVREKVAKVQQDVEVA